MTESEEEFARLSQNGLNMVRAAKAADAASADLLARIRELHSDAMAAQLDGILANACEEMVRTYLERDAAEGVPRLHLAKRVSAAREKLLAALEADPLLNGKRRRPRALEKLEERFQKACEAAGVPAVVVGKTIPEFLACAKEGRRVRQERVWDHAWAVRDTFGDVLQGSGLQHLDVELDTPTALLWTAFVRAALSDDLRDNLFEPHLIAAEGDLRERRRADSFILGLSLHQFIDRTLRIESEHLPSDELAASVVARRVNARNRRAIDHRLRWIATIAFGALELGDDVGDLKNGVVVMKALPEVPPAGDRSSSVPDDTAALPSTLESVLSDPLRLQIVLLLRSDGARPGGIRMLKKVIAQGLMPGHPATTIRRRLDALKDDGIVEAKPGPNGGYLLTEWGWGIAEQAATVSAGAESDLP